MQGRISLRIRKLIATGGVWPAQLVAPGIFWARSFFPCASTCRSSEAAAGCRHELLAVAAAALLMGLPISVLIILFLSTSYNYIIIIAIS